MRRGQARVSRRAYALGALLLTTAGAGAQQALLVADEGTNANAFRSQPGKVATFVCPSSATRLRDVWGTGTYHYESSICTAAVHAGVRTAGMSAQITIRMGGSATPLEGKSQNGVRSLPLQQTDATFSFVDNSVPAQIDWNTTYDRVPDDFSSPVTVVCSPNGSTDALVIGTDVYRSDSAICMSAVHAGSLRKDAGGSVTLTLQPKRQTLPASDRNGVSSASWSAPDYRAFPQPYSTSPGAVPLTTRTLTPAVTAEPRQLPGSTATRSSPRKTVIGEPTQPATPGPYAPGPRAIAVAGFTAVGSAPIIVPRIIALTGFVAVGTAPVIVPRIVPLAGWTATGSAPK
jgi:hypothetical protein